MAKSRVPRAPSTSARVLRLPMTNAWTGGRYSAELAIGGGGAIAKVILDTGSSSFAVDPAVYDGAGDAALKATSLAQLITYGAGGWAGPVVETRVRLGPPAAGITLESARLAIAVVHEGSLGAVDGILGLAFGGENPAWDLAPALAGQGATGKTWPWPFGTPSLETAQADLSALVQAHRLRETTVTPLLDQLVGAGLVADRFAFHTLRSAASARLGDAAADQVADPLNAGVFVLGGGESETDLFTGAFATVAVTHDLFYNLTLQSVRVGDSARHAAAPLQPRFKASLASNAILDTGNDQLRLASDVLQAVLAGLGQANPSFAQTIQRAQNGQPVAAALQLAAWPTLYFTFEGVAGEAVELAVAPSTYWQVDAPAAGQASLRIAGPLDPAANQSNFGLPLINNYYTVFDRSVGARGVVRFAPIKVA